MSVHLIFVCIAETLRRLRSGPGHLLERLEIRGEWIREKMSGYLMCCGACDSADTAPELLKMRCDKFAYVLSISFFVVG
jgi:hypothetical protein